MGINQFLDTEFLLPHTPSINIVCNSPCSPLLNLTLYDRVSKSLTSHLSESKPLHVAKNSEGSLAYYIHQW